MAENPCIAIRALPDPPALLLPGGARLEHLRLTDLAQPALAPLMPIFDIIDAVVAAFRCIQAIPDALGPPPDPTVIAACLPELGDKVAKLLQLVPQLSLPVTMAGAIDAALGELEKARAAFVHLQAQTALMTTALDRAAELEDAELAAIAVCARDNIDREAGNVGKNLASLGALLGVLGALSGLIGGPAMPDLSSLSGQPLDQVLAPLDALIEQLQAARAALPLP